MSISRILLGSLILGFFISVGCSNQSGKDQKEYTSPNIVWINAEDISPVFGAYGDSNAITPNIDSLAKKALTYKNAFAVAPICSPSRSTLVTGLYATTTGTQHLRSETPYPQELKTMPTLFSEAGYFTSIFGKSDYNFDPEGLWEYWSEDKAPWRQRKGNQPFLSVFTINTTHEGKGNSKEKYTKEIDDNNFTISKNRGLVPVPPYFPDTEEVSDLMNRYYDLVTVFDLKVGEIIKNLEDDGLLENTIIFIFSDHGFGLPRYKRWLYKTGLHVPLIIYLPEKFQHLTPHSPGSSVDELVSFVDFVPTSLSCADINIPDYIQGFPFLKSGEESVKRDEVFAFRSRADNVYDMSRAIIDDRYIYIRHFMPHLPYIQSSKIFSDDKEGFRILIQKFQSGELHEEGQKMFHSKPIEELYDLKNDPYELNNLAMDPDFHEVKSRQRNKLKEYILNTRDLGFLYESEMVRRSEGAPPYYLGLDEGKYNLDRIYQAAEVVGSSNLNEIRDLLTDKDPGVQFWGIMAAKQLENIAIDEFTPIFQTLSESQSPAVSISAQEILYSLTRDESYLWGIIHYLDHQIPEVVLQAARALEISRVGNPDMIKMLKTVLERYKSPMDADFPYIDYNFALFISWSIEAVIEGFNI